MKNLLDTYVIAEYQKPAPEPKVINWLDSQIEESLFLSVLTIGEIEKGIARLPASKRKNNLEMFLGNLVTRFDQRILPLDTHILRRWGKLTGSIEKKGRVLPIVDSLLAAQALEYDLTIVTRNTSDFTGTGARILNIWD
jgi:predicted nucleic acid-binding protein